MQRETHDFLLRGQVRVVTHYRKMLALPGLTEEEAAVIRRRILFHEAELELLRDKPPAGSRVA
jgi:hypothetical protein